MCTYNSFLLPNSSIGKYRHHCCYHNIPAYNRHEETTTSIDDLKKILYKLELNGQSSHRQIREAENLVSKIDYQEKNRCLSAAYGPNDLNENLESLKLQLKKMQKSIESNICQHRENTCTNCKLDKKDHFDEQYEMSDYEDYSSDNAKDYVKKTSHQSRTNYFDKDLVDQHHTGSKYHLNCHQTPFDSSYTNNNIVFPRSKSFDKLPKERNLSRSARSRSPSPLRRYFMPKQANDLRRGDWIKFKRKTLNNCSAGQVKYVGHLPGKNGIFVGVELFGEVGNNSGMFNGFEYFKCKLNQGIFVPFEKVLQAWTYTS